MAWNVSEPQTSTSRTPPTMVGKREAARMFGISHWQWGVWERQGRVTIQHAWVPSGKGPWLKVYAVDDLLALREEFRKLVEPYPDPERPGCYRVPLARRTFAAREAIIDAESLPLVQGRGWHWEDRGDGSDGYVALAATSGSNTPLRRVILGLQDAGYEPRISHANGDPLDCRRENLIVRSIAEQLYASRKKGTIDGREYTSKYKGVSWDEPRGKWKAQLQHEGKNRFIGRYDEEEDAAAAYDERAREVFGEHARLNFPDEPPARLAA